MSQTGLLIDTLKRQLKLSGVTYADLAGHLQLSETSIKRCFAEKNFTLQRLEAICAVIHLSLTDLAKLADEQQARLEMLSEEQEKSLVAEPKLLLLAYLLLHGCSYAEVRQHYAFDEHEGIQYLAKLDRLGLIELQPNNRVKLLTASHFAWRKNGPIQQYFNEHIREEFFQSHFHGEGELMVFVSGMVSAETIRRFHHKLERLSQEFNEAAKADTALPFDQRFGCSLVGAFRPWEFSNFAEFRKADAK